MTQMIKKTPIVTILQFAAALLFIVAVLQAGINMNVAFSPENGSVGKPLIKFIQEELYYILYEPLILLGLAEIIKSMKEKKNDQN